MEKAPKVTGMIIGVADFQYVVIHAMSLNSLQLRIKQAESHLTDGTNTAQPNTQPLSVKE